MELKLNEANGRLNKQMVLNQFVLVQPTELYDARVISDHIRQCRSVLLNIESLDSALKLRILDFVGGFVYSLQGSVSMVTKSLYLIAPCGVDIER